MRSAEIALKVLDFNRQSRELSAEAREFVARITSKEATIAV
jgi:hypothetical protein